MILIASSADARIMKWAERITSAIGTGRGSLPDLQNYGRLCGLARRQKNRIEEAKPLLYLVRTTLENDIVRKMRSQFQSGNGPQRNMVLYKLFKGDVFGRSTKQGISFRLPLLSCNPTPACKVGCYAHDGRDAAPGSVVRGAYNGLIAQLYEWGDEQSRDLIMSLLRPKADLAVKHALEEAQQTAKAGFVRHPRIRFSHVGDIARYPEFANGLAHWCIQQAWANPQLFQQYSDHRLHCVTYTRRLEAKHLDPRFWKVLFTIDHTSADRVKWIPKFAKKAWCCFDGWMDKSAYVAFAEHHGLTRMEPSVKKGDEKVLCPSTRAGFPHGCDNNRCERCFV